MTTAELRHLAEHPDAIDPATWRAWLRRVRRYGDAISAIGRDWNLPELADHLAGYRESSPAAAAELLSWRAKTLKALTLLYPWLDDAARHDRDTVRYLVECVLSSGEAEP